MLRRGRFLNIPMVMGAVLMSRKLVGGLVEFCSHTMIGVVSGKAIFGPPLDEYWRKKLEEEARTDTETK